MKIYVFVLLIVAAVAFALPFDEDEDLEPVNNGPELAVTCDLMSGLKVQHSACAAHCIAKGRTGGSCKGGICNCRKTKLWKG